ncbi:hypothetical protein RUM44_005993 [Polyplax serrata]|uniref:Uncharacterized protein n=1 Tax=Polyplax serrata TaxID=468196 RepID=A0ABR1B0J8_POLSC
MVEKRKGKERKGRGEKFEGGRKRVNGRESPERMRKGWEWKRQGKRQAAGQRRNRTCASISDSPREGLTVTNRETELGRPICFSSRMTRSNLSSTFSDPKSEGLLSSGAGPLGDSFKGTPASCPKIEPASS